MSAQVPLDPLPPGLSTRVEQLTRAVVVLAGRRGADELTTAITDEVARLSMATTTVVVAGEPGSGKSSLINAMLGRPGLLPTGASTSTATHIIVRQADEPGAWLFAGEEAAAGRVDLDAISEPAVTGRTVDGEPIGRIEIGIPHPLLARGLALVDTPGVSGLSDAHARITLAALRTADALVFTTSAGAELTAVELAFLASATERVEMVIIALTKVDVFPAWRTVIERDRLHLSAGSSPRFRDLAIVPTSTVYAAALEGSGVGPPEVDTLRDLAGIAALNDHVVGRVVARLQFVRLGNLIRLCSSALARLRLGDMVQEPEADPALVAALESEQGRLDGLRRSDARWRGELGDRFAALQTALLTDMNHRLTQLRRRYHARITGKSPIRPDAVAAMLGDELRALWTDLTTRLDQDTIAIASELEGAFTGEWVPLSARAIEPPDRLARAGFEEAAGDAEARSRADLVAEVSRLVYAVLPGVTLAGPAAWLFAIPATTALAFTIPIGIALGSAAFISGRVRARRVATRQQALSLLSEMIEDLRADISPMITSEVQRRRRGIERAMHERLTARAAAAAAALAERRATLEADTAERRRRRAEAAARLEATRPLLAEVERLGSELRLAASRTGAPGHADA